MFGFLHPQFSGLTGEEIKTQKAYLCGLCKGLSSEYGTLARVFTTHEGSLLYMLFDAQVKENPLSLGKQWCPLNPIKKTTSVALSPDAARFATAASMLLFAAKLNDDIQDEKASAPRFVLFVLKGKIRKAEAVLNKLGLKSTLIAEKMKEQQMLEQKSNLALEEYAEPTALLLATLFSFTSELTLQLENKPLLSRLGYRLGQTIYLLDSFTDYSRDARLNCFNSLRSCTESSGHRGVKDDVPLDIKNKLHSILARNLRDIETDLDGLILYRNRGIIQNILVASLQRSVQQILQLNKNHKEKTYTAELKTMLKLAILMPLIPIFSNGCDGGGGSYTVTPNTDCCGGESYTVTPKSDCDCG